MKYMWFLDSVIPEKGFPEFSNLYFLEMIDMCNGDLPPSGKGLVWLRKELKFRCAYVHKIEIAAPVSVKVDNLNRLSIVWYVRCFALSWAMKRTGPLVACLNQYAFPSVIYTLRKWSA